MCTNEHNMQFVLVSKLFLSKVEYVGDKYDKSSIYCRG